MKTFDLCPMIPISVVIICRNEAGILGQTLQSLAALTDDVVVYDSGSTDGTIEIAQRQGARVVHGEWRGYGLTKRAALAFARHEWILSLDADESLDPELRQSLLKADLSNTRVVYELKFLNHLGKKPVRFGEWGGDSHIRLFNRGVVNWNDAPVHENLEIPGDCKVRTLDGHVLHYTARDLKEYKKKLEAYAALNAKKYLQQGKKSSWLKIYLSPAFSFLRNYFFRLGFLDGAAGYHCARMTARYTYLKYARLQELNRG